MDSLYQRTNSFLKAWLVLLFILSLAQTNCAFAHISANPEADAMRKQLLMYQPDTAGFTTNFGAKCFGSAVHFFDTSSDGVVSYLWDFGDFSTSTEKNPVHTFPLAGDFVVTLKVTFANENTASKSQLIKVLPLPSSNFTVLPVAGLCKTPMTLKFTPDSSKYLTYSWNFDDPSVLFHGESNLVSPDFTYSNFGKYNVRLQVVDKNGCMGITTRTIPVTKPAAGFKALSSPNGCAPQTISFRDTSISMDAIVMREWDFGDGTVTLTETGANTTHVYAKPGTFSVKLKITTQNGCTDEVLLPDLITINQPALVTGIATDRVNNGLACRLDGLGNGIKFTPSFDAALPAPDSVMWNWGDSSSVWIKAAPFATSKTYTNTGVYTVSLKTSKGGCTSLYTMPGILSVLGPISRFTTLNSGMGCDSVSTIQFSNTASIDGKTGNTTYTWNFGDGPNQVLPKGSGINHTYTLPGDYKVVLKASNEPGTNTCTDYFTSIVHVSAAKPSFSLIPEEAVSCSEFPIRFRNTSKIVNAKIAEYLWDFGDGTTASLNDGSDVTHIYAPRLQAYKAKLIIREAGGCVYTSATQEVLVYGPVPDFSVLPASSVCHGSVVQFKDLSLTIPSDNAITAWLWDFGDVASGIKNTSVEQEPSHIFSAPGTYTVSLKVTDNQALPLACNQLITKTVVILPPPNAAFITPDNRTKFCTKSSVPILLTNISTGDAPLSYHWSFGGTAVNSGSNTNPLIEYAADGVYSVKLTVTAGTGCTTQTEKLITTTTPDIKVFPEGRNSDVAPFSYDCPPVSIDFRVEALPSANLAGLSGFIWDFGDGKSGSGQNPQHIYEFSGDYTVKLSASSDAGCMITKDLGTFIAVKGPRGQFTYDKTRICTPETVTFRASSLIDVQSLAWDFGDGTTSSEHTLTAAEISSVSAGQEVLGINLIYHKYTKPGVFSPKLVLKNAAGCRVSYPARLEPISSSGSPLADFEWQGNTILCMGLKAKYSDKSLKDPSTPANLLPEITAWDWRFYKDATGTVLQGAETSQEPLFSYNSEGTYAVDLIVVTGFGCKDTVRKLINVVKSTIVPDLQVITKEACPAEMLEFDGSKSTSYLGQNSLGLKYLWTFFDLDGISVLGTSADAKPIFAYSLPGKYKVKLELRDEALCVENKEISDAFEIFPNPALIQQPQPVNVCEGSEVIFSATVPASTLSLADLAYQWEFNDGLGWVSINDAATFEGFSGAISSKNASEVLNLKIFAPKVVYSLNNYAYRLKLKFKNSVQCESYSTSAVLTVSKPPTPAMAGLAQDLCDANTFTMAANIPAIGTGNWSKLSGPAATIADENLPNTSINQVQPGVYVFQWTISNGACPPSFSDVTIKNSQPANAGQDSKLCTQNQLTLNANDPSLTGGTGKWTSISGPTLSFVDENKFNTQAKLTGGLGSYRLKWQISGAPGCGTTADEVLLTNFALPAFISQPANTTVCSGQAATFSVNASPALAFQWEVDDNSGSGFVVLRESATYSGVNTSVLTINAIPGNFDQNKYRCIIINSSTTCQNSSSPALLTVLPAPNNAVSDPGVCPASAARVTVQSTNLGYLYQLFDPSNRLMDQQTGTGADINFAAFVPPQSGQYFVKLTTNTVNGKACTLNLSDKANVTVFALPLTSLISGPSAVCANSVQTFSVAKTAGSSYFWTVPAGATILSGQGTEAVSVHFTSVLGNITVTETNANGCTGLPVAKSTLINPLPQVSLNPLPSQCINGDDLNLVSYGNPSSPAGVYSGPAGSVLGGNTFRPASTGVGTHTLTYTYTDVNGCVNSANGNILVNPVPNPLVSGPTLVCTNSIYSYSTKNNVGNSYLWNYPVSGTSSGPTSANSIQLNWGGSAGPRMVTVTETNSLGCSATSAGFVSSLVVSPTATLSAATTACEGNQIKVEISENKPFTYTYTLNGASPVTVYAVDNLVSFISNAQIGQYAISSITDKYGCSSSPTSTLLINPLPPDVSLAQNTSVCQGEVANVLVTKTSPEYAYFITDNGKILAGPKNGNGNTLDFNILAPASTTVYPVLISNPSTSCARNLSSKATVFVNLKPVPVISGNSSVCELSSGQIYSTTYYPGNTYSWEISGGSITQGASSHIITVSWGTAGVGTLRLTETSASGCTNTSTVYQVTIVPKPIPIANISVNRANFCADDAGDITLSSSGGSGSRIIWNTGSCGAVFSGVEIPDNKPDANIKYTLKIPSPTETTTYFAHWENGCGVSECRQITVLVNPLPENNLTVTKEQDICSGQAAIISVLKSETDISYQLMVDNETSAKGAAIEGNNGTIDFSVNPFSSVKYKIRATNLQTNCAIDLLSKSSVRVDYLLNAGLKVSDDIICTGGTASFVLSNSVSGVNYQLQDGSTNIDGQLFSGNGGTLTFSAKPGSSRAYSILATVELTSCSGKISDPAQVTVLNPPASNLGVSDAAICQGQEASITLSNSSLNDIYKLMKDGSADVLQTIIGTGTDISFSLPQPAESTFYTISATNPGCTINLDKKAKLTVNSLPLVFNVTGGGEICSGGNGVSISLNGSQEGFIYQFYKDNLAFGLALVGNGLPISLTNQSNPGIYSVQASSPQACRSEMAGSASISLQALPSAPLSVMVDKPTICENTLGKLTLTATGGAGNTLAWYTGACGTGFVGTGSPLSLPIPVATTQYYARWENACGQSLCQAVKVNILGKPSVSLSGDAPKNTICPGTEVKFTATGASAYEFFVNGISAQKGNSNTFTCNYLNNEDIVAVVGDNGGCTSDYSSMAIKVAPLPKPKLWADTTEICTGSSLIFRANGGDLYEFFVNGVSVQGPSGAYTYITNQLIDSSTVKAIVTNSYACSQKTVPLVIRVCDCKRQPTAVSDYFKTLKNTPISLPVLNNDLWGSSKINSASLKIEAYGNPAHGSAFINENGTITYTPNLNFTGTDSLIYEVCNLENLCDTAKVYISVADANHAPIVEDDFANVEQAGNVVVAVLENDYDVDNDLVPSTLKISKEPISKAMASITEANTIKIDYQALPYFIGNDTLTYQVCDKLGNCAEAMVIIQTKINQEFGIIIPEGFSPNGDNVNDKFEIPGIDKYPNNQLRIYNRWGNLVFSTRNYQGEWDGTEFNSNERLPVGTYFYVLDLENGRKPVQGYVYLNR
jgi:gliding motility-associated-like protein